MSDDTNARMNHAIFDAAFESKSPATLIKDLEAKFERRLIAIELAAHTEAMALRDRLDRANSKIGELHTRITEEMVGVRTEFVHADGWLRKLWMSIRTAR